MRREYEESEKRVKRERRKIVLWVYSVEDVVEMVVVMVVDNDTLIRDTNNHQHIHTTTQR